MTIAKKNIIIVALLVAVIACFVYSYRLSSERSGADAVRGYINATGEKQQSAINRLEGIESGLSASINATTNIANRLEDVESSIRNAQDRISTSEARVDRSTESIRQVQSILEQIRKRSQAPN